jgi:hypothetical protein
MELAMFQQRRGVFTVALVIVFVLAMASTFIYLRSSGKLADYKINMFSSIGTDNLGFNEDEKVADAEKDFSIGVVNNDEGKENVSEISNGSDSSLIIPAEKKYEEVAGNGDSITTLARKAIKEYMDENGVNINSEQRVFCEDYIQKKIGDKGINAGESVVVSSDLITEAVHKSLDLSPSQLENLTNFTELIWESGFRF